MHIFARPNGIMFISYIQHFQYMYFMFTSKEI